MSKRGRFGESLSFVNRLRTGWLLTEKESIIKCVDYLIIGAYISEGKFIKKTTIILIQLFFLYYEYQSFSKSDKKKLVALVEVGVKNEIEQFLKKSLAQHQKIVNTTPEDIRKPYWKLADSFKNFSKNLTRTYDDWSHRELPNMIAILIVDGVLSEAHIADFTPEGKEKMAAMVQRIRNYRNP